MNALANGATNAVNQVYQAEFTQAWEQDIKDRISYSPSTGTYTYYAANSGSGPDGTGYIFPTSSAVPARSGSPFADGNFSTFATKDASTGNIASLIIFKPGSANSKIALSYTTFGLISFAPVNIANARETRYFVIGNIYNYNGINGSTPISGTATYSGISNGVYHDTAGNYITTGTASLTADFNNGVSSPSVNFTMTFTGVNIATGGPSLGSTTFSGYSPHATLAGATFSGDLSGPTSGQFFGNFYGPSAAEFGLTYVLGGGIPSSSSINGMGVAVGKKN